MICLKELHFTISKQKIFELFFSSEEKKLINARDAIEFSVSVLSQREAVFTQKQVKETKEEQTLNVSHGNCL